MKQTFMHSQVGWARFSCPRGFETAWADENPVCPPCQTGHFPPREGGAALIVSLIILLLLTLIGITSMSTTTLEEKMAGNMRDRNLALQAAESALRAGETALVQIPGVPDVCAPAAAPPCAWAFNAPGNFLALNANWWAGNGRPGAALAGVSSAPRFIIEDRAAVISDGATTGTRGASGNKGPNVYRITARGTGGTDEAQVLIQSTFIKRFN